MKRKSRTPAKYAFSRIKKTEVRGLSGTAVLQLAGVAVGLGATALAMAEPM